MTTSDWLGLAGKTALVTGGGNGIGLATAQAFLDVGARVVILDRDPATPKVAEKLTLQDGAWVRSFLVDVRDRAALQGLRAALEQDGCPLDIVVPNAGISIRLPMLEVRPEQVDEIIATNLPASRPFRLPDLGLCQSRGSTRWSICIQQASCPTPNDFMTLAITPQ